MFRPLTLTSAACAAACVALSAQNDHTLHLVSAPVPNTTLDVRIQHPVSDAGSSYVLFISAHTDVARNLGLPFVRGLFRLDDLTLATVAQATLGATGRTVASAPIPDNPALVGVAADVQSATLRTSEAVILLSDNDVALTIVAGVGSVHLWQGTSPSRVTGDFEPTTVDDRNLGDPGPDAAAPTGAFQVIRTKGQPGYVEGFPATFSATPGASDIRVDRKDRVARRLINSVAQTIALPNGFDLAILRDFDDCQTVAPASYRLVSIEQADCAVHELTGSSVTDSALTCQSANEFSPYRPYFAFRDDGTVAAAIVHDSQNAANPDTGPADRVVLIHTDPAQTWSASGQNVLDVSPTGNDAVHTWFDDTLRVAGGVVFVEGHDPAGSGDALLYAGPADGSASLTPVAVPPSGTGLAFRRSYGEWRISDDRTVMVFRSGGGQAGSNAFDDDVVAITGITPTGPWTAVNVTQFAAQTRIAAFGAHTIGRAGIRADLSPDGTKLAFCTGRGTAASPHGLFVAPTDGSGAGSLTNRIAGGVFAPQVVFVGNVHFVANDTVLFLAGSAGDACDWYALDVTTGTVSQVTNTATGADAQPFTQGGTTGNVDCRGTFASDSGGHLYFVRGWGGTRPAPSPLRNNLVAIDTQTLALIDITGNDFGSGGTAPAIFRGPSTVQLLMTRSPRPALELQLRRAPGASSFAYFVAEPAAGATAAVFNDCNVFRFDVDNATAAERLTTNAGSGALSQVLLINHLTVSPDGMHVAWAQRRGSATASEDVFVMPSDGSTAPIQLSVGSAPGQRAQTVTDGSIAFTDPALGGVAWSVGTGSLSVPFENAVAQWSRVQGQVAPLLLTLPPTPRPLRSILVLGASR